MSLPVHAMPFSPVPLQVLRDQLARAECRALRYRLALAIVAVQTALLILALIA